MAAQVGSLLGEGVAEGDRVPLFIELLVNVFWKILTKNAASPSVKPVVNPGMYLISDLLKSTACGFMTAKNFLSGSGLFTIVLDVF